MKARQLASKFVGFHAYSRRLERVLLKNSSMRINSYVLDAGCGDGSFFDSCFNTKKGTVAIDIDRHKIVKANGRYEQTVLADMRRMPFRNKVFDSILCNSVLEHIAHVEHAVKEFGRVTKGSLYVSLPSEVGNRMLKRLSQILYDHRNLIGFETWQKLFRKNGFKVRRLEKYNSPNLHTLYILSCVFPPLLIFSKLFTALLSRVQLKQATSLFIELEKGGV